VKYIRFNCIQKWILLIFALFLCSCSGQSKTAVITDPQEYVNELAKQGYTSVYNSYVFEKAGKSGKVWTAPFAGIKSFKMPSEMIKAKGTITASGGSETIPGSGLVTVDVNYLALPEADYLQLVNNLSLLALYARSDAGALKKYKELAADYSAASRTLFSVYGMKGNASEEDLRSLIKNIYVKYAGYDESLAALIVSMMSFYPAGSAEDYSFYIVQSGVQDQDRFTEQKNSAYFEEYRTLHGKAEKLASSFTFQRPLGLTEVNLSGDILSFETSDLAGNTVNSRDLFSLHKVTMINIWSTTCSVCLTEIPVLQKMNKQYGPEGAQVVGLLYDGDNPDALKEAKDFLAENGIDYLNIIANEDLKNSFPTQSFPMTYYFDAEGKMIGEPVIGANLKKYEEKMKENLANVSIP